MAAPLINIGKIAGTVGGAAKSAAPALAGAGLVGAGVVGAGALAGGGIPGRTHYVDQDQAAESEQPTPEG